MRQSVHGPRSHPGYPRRGYQKAYEGGVIITGGHTIEDKEPKYGLSVTGFVHPQKLLRNSSARPGDVLILTKPLGVGILMTAAQGDFVAKPLLQQLYDQMAQLNKGARDIMVGYDVHSCTDVTGFGLLGHACEMADGSGTTIHFQSDAIPYHKQALDMAAMGLIRLEPTATATLLRDASRRTALISASWTSSTIPRLRAACSSLSLKRTHRPWKKP